MNNQDIMEMTKCESYKFSNYSGLVQKLITTQSAKFTDLENSNSESSFNTIFGKRLKKQVSFTPYIFNECSARCRFFSERIQRKCNTSKGNNSICPDYSSKLEDILSKLKDTSLFLSISGMEPLLNLDQLENILQCFLEYKNKGGSISQKVIYSNLSEMVYQLQKIMDLIVLYEIDRIETSRHHYNEEINQSIMRFRDNQPILQNDNYVNVINRLSEKLQVRLVCVLQKTGIGSVSEIEKYINWGSKTGVSHIIFREISILGDNFNENITSRYIHENRISILDILNELPQDFELIEIVKGYYYYSFKYLYKNKMQIVFEVSDYETMIKHHNSDIINKLIYYPNGDLCMDWNNEKRIY